MGAWIILHEALEKALIIKKYDLMYQNSHAPESSRCHREGGREGKQVKTSIPVQKLFPFVPLLVAEREFLSEISTVRFHFWRVVCRLLYPFFWVDVEDGVGLNVPYIQLQWLLR